MKAKVKFTKKTGVYAKGDEKTVGIMLAARLEEAKSAKIVEVFRKGDKKVDGAKQDAKAKDQKPEDNKKDPEAAARQTK